jgi:hypothetical protein
MNHTIKPITLWLHGALAAWLVFQPQPYSAASAVSLNLFMLLLVVGGGLHLYEHNRKRIGKIHSFNISGTWAMLTGFLVIVSLRDTLVGNRYD